MDKRGIELNLLRPKYTRHPAYTASLLFPAGFETGTILPFPDGATSGQAAGKTVLKLGLAPEAVGYQARAITLTPCYLPFPGFVEENLYETHKLVKSLLVKGH